MLKDLKETINRALEIKAINNLSFVTIWKTGELFGFNFDKKPVGYESKEFSLVRKVIAVL